MRKHGLRTRVCPEPTRFMVERSIACPRSSTLVSLIRKLSKPNLRPKPLWRRGLLLTKISCKAIATPGSSCWVLWLFYCQGGKGLLLGESSDMTAEKVMLIHGCKLLLKISALKPFTNIENNLICIHSVVWMQYTMGYTNMIAFAYEERSQLQQCWPGSCCCRCQRISRQKR